MKKRLILLMAAVLALLSAYGQVSFTTDGLHHVIVLKPERTTGLDSIFVVYNTEETDMTFTSTTDRRVKWYTFEMRNGEIVTEAIPETDISHSGRYETTLDAIRANKGYIIREGNYRHRYWVINYADYYLRLNSFWWDDEPACDLLDFTLDGDAKGIYYYTIDGLIQELDREIELTYSTLEFRDSSHWEPKVVVDTLSSINQTFSIKPPLCNTVFKLSGDRFLKEWNEKKPPISTDVYSTQAVDFETIVIQEDRHNENEQHLKNGYGGSAPVNITFKGFPTDAVVDRMWQMARDQEFENITEEFYQNVVDYEFNDPGAYYMRYVVYNADHTCEKYSDFFTITVNISSLRCPNVFSPDGNGLNDYWRVTYSSLADFHCWIFNRWGTLVFETTDPGEGWDGKYNGRYVDTGVYYYVVTATGVDGQTFKKRGDISILRYKGGSGTQP